MSGTTTHRELLLSTVTVLSALTGYGGRVYAACSVVGTGTNYVCSGANATQQIVLQNDAIVTTVPGFGVDTTDGTALSITAGGALVYQDDNASSLKSTGKGLVVEVSGSSVSSIGSLAISTSGNIFGSDQGISTLNRGFGSITITSNGDVTGDGGRGIFARNEGSDITITTGAGSTVRGGNAGINANNRGIGSTTVTANGNVYGGSNNGIFVRNNGTDVTVTTGTGTTVVGGGNGIDSRNFGTGSNTITVNGDVTGESDDGIYASSNALQAMIAVGGSSTVTSRGTDADDFAIDTSLSGKTNLTVAGTLKGGAGGAVEFDQLNAYNDRLELRPGFRITKSSAANAKDTVLAGLGVDTLALGGTGNGTFDLDAIDNGTNTKQFQSFEKFEIESGAWSLSGATTAAFTQTGGTLGGNPTFGALTVTGGTLAPGNSIGTMTVNGAFTLGADGIYEVETDAAGNSDKVVVNGTVNLTGATLNVLAASGSYKAKTNYTIIANDGTDAVQGAFGSVFTNLAFLTATVDYAGGTGNDVVLTLERSATLFQDVAETRNQKAVAGALDQFRTDNPLFLTMLNQTAGGARQAFDALSGEIHATVAGTLVDDSRYAREAVLGRMMQASHQGGALGNGGPEVVSYDAGAMRLGGKFIGEEVAAEPKAQPLAFWTQGYGAWGTFDTDGNAATADRNLGGFISGMDAAVGGSWRVGLATGASFSDVSVDQRFSGATTKTYHLGGYVNGDVSGLALRGGGLWAWSEIETSRAVVFPGFFERQQADYDADTGQMFGEIAYPMQMASMEVEPFAGLAYVSVESGSFKERGGPQASLRTSGFDQDVGYTTVGLRAAKTLLWGTMNVTPHVEAAWLHAFDDVTPDASLAFAATGIGFEVAGVPLAEDSALLDAGLDLAVTDRLSAGVSYAGQFADSVSDNAVKGRLTWRFH